MLYYITSYYIISYYTVLCCIILYHIMYGFNEIMYKTYMIKHILIMRSYCASYRDISNTQISYENNTCCLYDFATAHGMGSCVTCFLYKNIF